MTIEVRDIASFENSQAIFAHYGAVRKRLRPKPRINALPRPTLPTSELQFQRPKRRQDIKLSSAQIVENCKNRLHTFADARLFKVDLFSTSSLPIEGILLQAEFFLFCVYQLGAQYKQLADITGLSPQMVRSICSEYDEYQDRLRSDDCDLSIEHNRDEDDPLMCIAVEVALKYRVTIEDILGKSTAKFRLMARQEFFYRSTHETSKARFAIGNFVNKDHTSVTSGLASHEARLQTFEALKIEGKS